MSLIAPSITAERKDASLHMLGKWIVEQAEFEGHVRSSVENMKAFITREREIFKPYGRAEINMRRPSAWWAQQTRLRFWYPRVIVVFGPRSPRARA